MAEFGFLAVIGICGIVFLYFYLIWVFIASAVKKGTLDALYEHDRATKRMNEANEECNNE